jgi:hypothetical protein
MEQALYVNNVAEPHLLQLLSSPTELIAKLAEHPAVFADSTCNGPAPGMSLFVVSFSSVLKINSA